MNEKNISNTKINNRIELSNIFNLLIIISDNGCQICIDKMIALINGSEEKYKKYFNVFFLGNDNFINKVLQLSYKKITKIEDVIITNSNIQQPILFLIDKNHNIILEHVIEVQNPQLTSEFFKRVKIILNSVMNI
ncbi:MAG: hypothetical protein AB1432_03365 [Bacteroidota bacterium]